MPNDEINMYNKINGDSEAVTIKFDPEIRNFTYNIINDIKGKLVDTIEGQQIKETYDINTWKEFFELIKEHLEPRATYIVVKATLGQTKGTPVYTYTKSLMLSGLANKNNNNYGNHTGLNDMIYSQMNDTNLAGIQTLQDELSSKHTYINNLQDQITENYRTLYTEKDKFESEKIQYLDKIKQLEIRVKELEQEKNLLLMKHELEKNFEKKLEKASSGDISQYLPLIQMFMGQGKTPNMPLPTMSAPPPQRPQVKMDSPEVEYL